MNGYAQIYKRQWYARGGFSNPRCVRVTRGNAWAYFYRLEN